MALMEHNKNPISLREGKVFVDGVEVMDAVKANIKFTPDTWSGRQLGERTPSTRWLGYSITVELTRRRSTPWIKDVITKYMADGATPEFTVQGIMDDRNSDFYAAAGTDTVTCVGCVLTGDLPLTALDSEGTIVDDSVTFNAKDIV